MLNPMWNLYYKLGLLVKWNGKDFQAQEASDWWYSWFPRKVSISHLDNDILFILCKNLNTKKEFFSSKVRLFPGHCFSFMEWYPNFDPYSFQPSKI